MSEVEVNARLFGTDVFKTSSVKGGYLYKISVWLPPGYRNETKSYPVIYLLDASLWFGMAVSTTLPLIWGQEIPEVVVVGIGYYHQGFDDIAGDRGRDFTPSPVEEIRDSGGAAIFLDFLETELIPYIDVKYRTDPSNRTLWGTSLSGLFVIYTLLEKPDLIHKYIAASPALVWNLKGFLRQIEDMDGQCIKQPTKLFLSVGSAEDPFDQERLHTLAVAFKRKKFPLLQIHSMDFTNETHFSQAALSYLTGLRALHSESRMNEGSRV